MKRLELSILLAFIFCITVSFFSFEGECEQIRDSVLRLHVLANSDSEEDQKLKLMVRDGIIELSEKIFADCDSYDDAKTAAGDNMELFELTAENILRQNGCSHSVSVSIDRSWFSTRTYGDITLPAGIYEALRIEIGNAQGKNWWCVMFPSVCLPSSAGEAELSHTLSAGQVEIVCSDGYELRFRCVELYEQFMEELRQSRGER